MRSKQVLLLQARVEQGVVAMRKYSTLSRSPEQEPHQ